jgi:hypothetical protein
VGYTLARTERNFDGINNGSWYPAKQDRTHDVSIVAICQLSKSWTFSATWVYYTGNAVTFPKGAYMIGDRLVDRICSVRFQITYITIQQVFYTGFWWSIWYRSNFQSLNSDLL